MRHAIVKCLAPVLAMSAMPISVSAQEFPSKNVTIVLPLAPGTGMDSLARVLAEDLQKELGRSVVVENQPGAALMLAARNVARATPDGHTLMVTSAPVMAINPTSYKSVGYDPAKDFAPVALYAKSPFMLVASPALGVTSVADFFKKAKESSAKPFNYATPGAGTIQHLTMEILKRDFAVKMDHVPYRVSTQIITDLVGGHINASISETPAALPLIKDGKLKALAMTSSSKNPQLPEVPTLAEVANKPGFDAVSWHVLLAPSGTPQSVLDRLVSAAGQVTRTPEFQKRIVDLGLQPVQFDTPAAMRKYIDEERERWSNEVKSLGMAGTL